MEHPEKAPQRHSELHDPKLPQIHSGRFVSPEETVLRPAPLPLPPKEL
ncbi:MAG: hypothetical protein IJ453_06465 [Oscillospiraceae bacterium]|nr:hypothetical protein [Oscillospiraceae bacterium]